MTDALAALYAVAVFVRIAEQEKASKRKVAFG
jgi:hypothetical protein